MRISDWSSDVFSSDLWPSTSTSLPIVLRRIWFCRRESTARPAASSGRFRICLSVRLLLLGPEQGPRSMISHPIPVDSTGHHRGKRLFDLLVALALAPVAVPICLLAAIPILLETGCATPFLPQVPVGRNGFPFAILKLRTMAPVTREGASHEVGG